MRGRSNNSFVSKRPFVFYPPRVGSGNIENCRVHKEDFSNKDRVAQGVNERFTSQKTDKEALLKSETVGLVDLNEFQKIKDQIDSGEAESKGKKSSFTRKENSVKRKAESSINKTKLSFQDDEDIVNDDNSNQEGTSSIASSKRKKMSKNPSVDTSFLPDRDREDFDFHERQLLKAELLKQQELIKNEEVKIPFLLWDGSGHPFSLTIKKGDTIESFLTRAKQEIVALRGLSVDRILFVKDDLIIQPHYSFYDLMLNKIRGKGKPLFEFHGPEVTWTIHERPLVVNVTWYENNKNLLPGSRWESFNASRHFV